MFDLNRKLKNLTINLKMNLFRFVADFLHLLSFLFIIQKIRTSKNCIGKY